MEQLYLSPENLNDRHIVAVDIAPHESPRLIENNSGLWKNSKAGLKRVHAFRLAHNEVFFLQHLVHFRVCRGAVEIFGHVYEASPDYIPVVLPLWSFSLPVKGVESSRSDGQSVAICAVQDRSRKTTIADIINNDIANGTNRSYPVLISFRKVKTCFGTCEPFSSVTATPSSPPFSVHPSWSRVIKAFFEDIANASSLSPPVIVITGNVGAGKTSFCSFLMNVLLNSLGFVYYLETDLGQPMFSPAGIVSLHKVKNPIASSPSSLVNSVPALLSFCVASFTPEDDQDAYMWSVAQCSLRYFELLSASKCRAKVESDVWSRMPQEPNNENCSVVPPLVVNTHGWVTGLGWQVIEAIGALTWAKLHVEIGGHFPTAPNNSPLTPSANGHQKFHQQKQTSHGIEVGGQRRTVANHGKLPFVGNPTPLDSPFEKIVKQACGFLPLPWTSNFKKLRHFVVKRGHNVAEDKLARRTPDIQKPLPKHLRWLRTASYFNPSYAFAVHFPHCSLEEFFGGHIDSQHVIYPHIQVKPVRIEMDITAFQLFAPIDEDNNSQDTVLRCLPNKLVSFGHDAHFSESLRLRDLERTTDASNADVTDNMPEDPNDAVVTKRPKPFIRQSNARHVWLCLGIGWIHSVDVENHRIIIYTASDVANPIILSAVNSLKIGEKYNWDPSLVPPPMPHEFPACDAGDKNNKLVHRSPAAIRFRRKIDQYELSTNRISCCSTIPYTEDSEMAAIGTKPKP